MSVIQRASFERRRRIQKRESLDEPFYITDEEAKNLAKDCVNLSINKELDEDDVYWQILDDEFRLYDFKVKVRG